MEFRGITEGHSRTLWNQQEGETTYASPSDCDAIQQKVRDLQQNYPSLFNSGFIQEADCEYPEMESINLDEFQIKPIREAPYLGTRHACTSTILCGKAGNRDKTYISLYHCSEDHPILKALEKIWEEFQVRGCEKSSIQIYLIGGARPHPGSPIPDLTEMQAILEKAKLWHICGVKIHIVNRLHGFDLVHSANGIFFRIMDGKRHLFQESLNEAKWQENFLCKDPWDRLNQMKDLYTSHGIYGNPVIEEKREPFPEMAHVDFDEGAVLAGPKGKNIYLGTKQVGRGIAICGRGTNVDGTFCIIGLFHMLHTKPNKAMKTLFEAMKHHGCHPESLHFFLVGGNLHSLELQEELLKLRYQYPIVGAKFNELGDIDDQDTTLSVAMSIDQVYYGNWELF